MPRTPPLIKPDIRGKELRGELAKMREMTGRSYKYLCKKAGIEYGTFMAHKKDIKHMRYGELWAFLDACEREMQNV